MKEQGIGGITVVVKTSELRDRIKANFETFKTAFAESLIGFDKERRRLLRAESRKPPTESLYLSLSRPTDHSDTYRTTIGMLEAHQGETIELSASEYRKLWMDEWDWSRDFWVDNAGYSSTASAKSASYV